MSVTSKGRGWELRHSIWIIWTLTLFFNWVAFFYIGIRVRQRKWVLWGLVYSVPFILAMFISEGPVDTWQADLTYGSMLVLWIISIFHALKIRKEYLMRLEMAQGSRPSADAALRQRIRAEHGASGEGSDSNRRVGEPASTASNTDRGSLSEPAAKSFEPTSPLTPQTPTVDLNTSSEQEIASLPGIGLIVAKRAVTLREARGGFHSVEDFGEALNLKPHVVNRIRPLASASLPQQSSDPGSSGRVVDF